MFMAAEYQQYQSSPEAQKANMVNMAANRLDTYVEMGHERFSDGPKFFKDVYLLKQAGFFNIHPEKVVGMQRLASYPNVRTEFFNTLKSQDGASQSEEVLASVGVGEVFEYNMDRRNNHFRVLFDGLKDKHTQLITEAENKKTREAAAAAAARRRANATWGPPETNVGKSPEWIAVQEKVARLWAGKSRTLPQGVARETEAASLDYLRAGFSIIHEQILSDPPKDAVEVRAMVEYLIPKMWAQPRQVEVIFKEHEKAEKGRPKPTNLREVATIPKILFIPEALKNSTTPPDKDQSANVRKLHRAYNMAMHPDVGNNPNVNASLKPQVDKIIKEVNRGWRTVRPLVS